MSTPRMLSSDPWLYIRLKALDGEIWWCSQASDRPRWFVTPNKLSFTSVTNDTRIPSALIDWIHETIASLRSEEGSHQTSRLALSDLVSPWSKDYMKEGHEPRQTCKYVEETLKRQLDLDLDLVIVALSPLSPKRRKRPFSLPIRLTAVAEYDEDGFDAIKKMPWYRDAMREYGIVLSPQVPNGANRDAVTEDKPVQGRALHLSVGLSSGPASQLGTKLSNRLSSNRVLENSKGDSLVDMLWDGPERPAVLLILAHLEFESLAGDAPREPRLTSPGDRPWLRWQEINNMHHQMKYRFLKDPSPVVILAACDSARSDLSTFVDFVNSFDGAGAAAVVGTETTIIQQFAAVLGEELALGLHEARRISEVVLEFRQQEIIEMNPLGVAVTTFDDAKLALA